MKLIDAYKLAERLHAGRADLSGQPYIGHLTRVMLYAQQRGADPEQLIAALLHDSMEDAGASYMDLIKADVPRRSVELVFLLTKPKGLSYLEYLERVAISPSAVLVKLADIDDNSDPERLQILAATDRAKAERLAQKYRNARAFLGDTVGC